MEKNVTARHAGQTIGSSNAAGNMRTSDIVDKIVYLPLRFVRRIITLNPGHFLFRWPKDSTLSE